MSHKVKLFLLGSMMVLLLSNCGGGSSDGDSSVSTTTTTKINSFDASGTATVSGVLPIDPSVNGGEFTVDWNVDSSDPYRFVLYISQDNVFNSTDDVLVHQRNCGSNSILYLCNDIGSETCSFDTQNMMGCGVSSPGNRPADLTIFIDAIPKTAYLILHACDALQIDCKASAIAIELR